MRFRYFECQWCPESRCVCNWLGISKIMVLLQKAVFRVAIDGLLRCNLRSFAARFAAFCKMACSCNGYAWPRFTFCLAAEGVFISIRSLRRKCKHKVYIMAENRRNSSFLERKTAFRLQLSIVLATFAVAMAVLAEPPPAHELLS